MSSALSATPAQPYDDSPISVRTPDITIRTQTTITAETAATLLADAPTGDRLRLFERIVEIGAGAELTYRSNITTQLFERRLEGLGVSLRNELDTVVKAGGQSVEERLVRTLHRFEKDLAAWTTRYIDPASSEGLPTIAAGKLRQVTESAIKQLGVLLADGEDGALAKWSDRIGQQVQESERHILAQLVQKQAIDRTGVHRGRGFEEVLSYKLAQVGLAMGCEVQRCSDLLGTTRMRCGDHLLTFPEGIRVVVEAKSQEGHQRFGHNAVDKACQQARANRDAAAAVFVSELRECLPDGVPFGQVSRGNFFVEFCPDGDDIGLVAALYLAKASALQSVQPARATAIDVETVTALARDVRERVEHRSRIRTLHSSALKAINNATKVLDEDTEALLVCLARLDAQLLVSPASTTESAEVGSDGREVGQSAIR